MVCGCHFDAVIHCLKAWLNGSYILGALIKQGEIAKFEVPVFLCLLHVCQSFIELTTLFACLLMEKADRKAAAEEEEEEEEEEVGRMSLFFFHWFYHLFFFV